jgi:hypothetical protein
MEKQYESYQFIREREKVETLRKREQDGERESIKREYLHV